MKNAVIIILTFNQKETTLRCLRMLYDTGNLAHARVLLWDNGSQDGTADRVREQYPDVYVQAHPTNLGVAGGRNAAAALAIEMLDADYLLFLDNDIEVTPGFVQALRDALNEDEGVGQVQAKLRMWDDRERLNDGGGVDIDFVRWQTIPVGYGERDEGQYDQMRPCYACEGGVMMVRARLFQELGGFDTLFNPYGPEDLDFSLRLQKAGRRALYVPQAMGYHAENHTFGRGYSEEYARHKLRHWYRLMRRHASLFQQAAFFTFGGSYLIMTVVAREIKRGNFGAVRGLARGLLDLRRSTGARGEDARRKESMMMQNSVAKVSHAVNRAILRDTRALQVALLLAITLLALFLRLYRLGDWSFWIDEFYTVRGARFIEGWRLPELPLYLVLTRLATDLFGPSDWSARLMPAITGAVTPLILFFPVKRLFNRRVALIFMFLMAVAPWHVWWSQNARFYALLLLFYNSGLLLLFLGLERRDWRLLGPGLLLLLMAGRERQLGFLFLPVVGAYVAFLTILPIEKPSWLRIRTLLLLLLPGILFLLYDAYYFSQTGESAVGAFISIFVGNPIDSPVRILTLILFNVGLPVVVLASFSGLWLVSKRRRVGLFLLMAAVAPVALLLAVSPFVFTVDRYAFVTLPAWLILAAVAIERLAGWLRDQARWLVVAVALVLVADAGEGLFMYYQLNEGNRPNWRDAFYYVASQKDADDLIVSPWPEIGHYYLGESTEIVSLNDINPRQLESGDRRVWFVVDSEAVWFAPPRNKQWMEREAELLLVWYLRTRERLFIEIYRYDPPQLSEP